jgi:hypothetical protein
MSSTGRGRPFLSLSGSTSFLPPHRAELHDEDIAARAVVDHREDRRVARVADVPVCLAVDLDGLEGERQTRRGEHRVDADFGIVEDLDRERIGTDASLFLIVKVQASGDISPSKVTQSCEPRSPGLSGVPRSVK